jgi:2-hydroxycyclohexanecarboxyl-CoA dehydrogenase
MAPDRPTGLRGDLDHVVRPTLVTGAGGDIGRAIADALRADGHPVAIADLDLAKAERAAAAPGAAPAIALQLDVTDSAAVREAVALTVEAFGGLGSVVTCAGMHRPTPLDQTDDAFARGLVAVNFLGTFYVCREAHGALAAHGSGRIVTIGSDSSRAGLPKGSVYSATKGAVNSLTRSLAMELARDGITVNCVSPGTVDTEMLRESAEVDPRQMENLVRTVPLRRLARPEEIAAAVAFLCSDAAAYITAQIVPVNGGAHAG